MKISVMLTTLLRRAQRLPKIRLTCSPKSIQSGLLCWRSNLQVEQRAAPIASKTRRAPITPSLMNIMGQTIIEEPTMVLARLVTTLKELSPPYLMTSEFLSYLIFQSFISWGRYSSSSISPTLMLTSALLDSIIKRYKEIYINPTKISIKLKKLTVFNCHTD